MALLPELIGDFQKDNPNVSLQIVRMETFPQLKGLIDGVLDIAFIRAPERYPPELTGFVVDRHPYYAAIPKDHPLAKRKQISLATLSHEAFIAGSLEMDVGFWGNLGAVSKPGQPLRIVQRAPDIFSLLTLVAAGAGLGIISEPMRGLGIPGIVYRKISGALQEAEIAVAYRKRENAPAVKSFVQRLRTQSSDVFVISEDRIGECAPAKFRRRGACMTPASGCRLLLQPIVIARNFCPQSYRRFSDVPVSRRRAAVRPTGTS